MTYETQVNAIASHFILLYKEHVHFILLYKEHVLQTQNLITRFIFNYIQLYFLNFIDNNQQ